MEYIKCNKYGLYVYNSSFCSLHECYAYDSSFYNYVVPKKYITYISTVCDDEDSSIQLFSQVKYNDRYLAVLDIFQDTEGRKVVLKYLNDLLTVPIEKVELVDITYDEIKPYLMGEKTAENICIDQKA